MKKIHVLLLALLACLVPRISAQQVLFTFIGDQGADDFGQSVAMAGDLNGDGMIDLIVGADRGLNCVPGGYARAFSLKDGSILFTVEGDCDLNGRGEELGFSVSGTGDVTGDGLPDVIVGSPQDDLVGTDTGSAKLFRGPSGSPIRNFTGTPYDRSLFGRSVAGLGDVNGDGTPDVVVGAQDDGVGGAVFLFSGKDGSQLDYITGEPDWQFGLSVCRIHDLNGDGIDDFLVGAPHEFGPSGGLVRAFSGADRSILFTLYGSKTLDGFGASVADAGDLDHDGMSEIIVGSPDVSYTSPGQAFVYSGADRSVLFTFTGDATKDLFGWGVAGVGDANGDGYPDLLVGSYLPIPGYAYLYSGKTGAPLYRFEGTSTKRDGFGGAVCGLTELNGDGFADFAIGASQDSSARGKVIVYLGNDLFLNARPRSVSAGMSEVLTSREVEAQAPMLLVVTALDGAPRFVPFLAGVADATGTWIISAVVPPGLSGHAISLRSFALATSGRVLDSADETVTFK